jgi:hypothetical protein
VAEDHTARGAAAEQIRAWQAHLAKLFGLNAPDKIQSDVAVHYVIEGTDVDKI